MGMSCPDTLREGLPCNEVTEMSRRQLVMLDRQGDASSRSPLVRGGKGAALSEMRNLGLPVPPSFTILTGASRAFLQEGKLPKRFAWHLRRGLEALERSTGKSFGDNRNPLLVSVRSGAPVSMPGMMDTILNVGLNGRIEAGLAALTNEVFAADCHRRLKEMFAKVSGDLPDDPYVQLNLAIEAVLQSWNSERARLYRSVHGIPDWHGTAVTVQAMVFGNVDDLSCTGVVFSRNVSTGEQGLYGEFLVKAQGEDIVSGAVTPQSILMLRDWNPVVYAELEHWVQKLEQHYGDVVDVEFTVQSGELFILQSRIAKRTPEAAATIAVHKVWDGVLSKQQAIESLGDLLAPISLLKANRLDQACEDQILARGLPASAGVASGRVVFSSEEAVRMSLKGEKVVLVRPDTSPEDLEGMLASVAIVTLAGGYTSHAAVVARGVGIPAVVSVNQHTLEDGELVTVDGTAGVVVQGSVGVGGSAKKEINILLRWTEQPAGPKIDFRLVESEFSVNTLVSDFYLTDALVQETRGTPLYPEAVKARMKVVTLCSQVLATYLLLAVAGEARHGHSQLLNPRAAVLMNKMGRRYGVTTPLASRITAHDSVMRTLLSRPDSARVEFLKDAVELFSLGGWKTSHDGKTSHGGKKWAMIAQAVLNYLTGKIPAVVFVDHAFDLEHNGGCAFDKRTMVSGLTNRSELKYQLDQKKHKKHLDGLGRALLAYANPEVVALCRMVDQTRESL